MIFDLITIFPEFFGGPFDCGILRRAREQGLIDIRVHDLRAFTSDKHRTVDDRPFGGGEGMVLKPEPVFAAVESLFGGAEPPPDAEVILLSAQGKLLTHSLAEQLAKRKRLVLICGRYEGVDERVAAHLATLELSIGDYVLTGGELPAAVVVDVVTRLLPETLGCDLSAVEESFTTHPRAQISAGGILDCPHYTRPADFRGHAVPEVLLSGHHEEVARWRRRAALEKTLRNRPDLLDRAPLSDADRAWLEEVKKK
ncbi:MAG TPA: tRNA (guanosine(37)-N1)-methyltransferase TrmD [Candidatus Xenobia bacterium]|nr:tRNA (guanosine(37)-N1)-methyltransferase TrmD [Candidatus Xenobia bacterium]